MAWERSFEARVLKIREKELKYQRLNYTIEASLHPLPHPFPYTLNCAISYLQTLWNAIWYDLGVLACRETS